MTHHITVPFRGDGHGTGELTWGQYAAWRSMKLIGITEWTGGTMPLDDGMTVQDVVTLLGFIMSRHQSLRTRLAFDADGVPRQVLSDAGEITLEVVDLGDDDDPATVAATVRERYEAAPWDATTDWPVRMAVLRRQDRAVHFVALYCHMVIDGYGFEALVADLANLEPGTGRHLAPVGGVQPLDLARAQRGPSARRQQAASLRYWERHLRAIEPQRFRDRLVPQHERWWEAGYTSPAMHLALAAYTERTKVHSGTVVLAAYAVVLARLSGQHTGVFRIVVSNRFRPGFAASVSNLAQAGLAVIDTAGCTFDEAVERAWKSQLAAGMYAYYDPHDLWALVDRVAAERAVELDTFCYYNDRRRTAAQTYSGPAPTADQVAAALPASTLRWGPSSDEWDPSCILHINTVPDTIDLTLRVDTTFVSPAGIEACLRGIESLIVAAAFDPALPADVDVPVLAPSTR